MNPNNQLLECSELTCGVLEVWDEPLYGAVD